MNSYLLFVFFTSLSIYHTDAVKVSIYYESRCHDSSSFIAYQLHPNYLKLKDYIQIEWIPYGKAIHNLVNNKWEFDCQHGPSECRGNKYQACALAQGNDQDTKEAFVHCSMSQRNPSDVKKIEMCARRANMNWEAIDKCGKTSQGDDLLARHGDRTNELEPNLSFVPTVIYNDEYDDFLQQISLSDFTTTVCSKIEGKKPRVCKGRKLPERNHFY